MRYIFSAGVVGAALFAGVAAADTYVCNIKPTGHDTGWISKTLAIHIDDVTGEVLVSDTVILHYKKGPIAGRVSTSAKKRLTVTWEVRGVTNSQNQSAARFIYRATIYKLTNKVIISGRPSGYDSTFSGAGKCEVRP